MLRGADGPHEGDAAHGGGAGVVGGEEGAELADLMGDADAAGEEDDGAVRVEGGGLTVGAFDEAGEVEFARGAGGGAVVQFARHAGALGHDEGDGVGRLGDREVLLCHWKHLHVRGDGSWRCCAGPGDGEGMRLQPRDAGEIDVGVSTGLVNPGSRKEEGHPASITR